VAPFVWRGIVPWLGLVGLGAGELRNGRLRAGLHQDSDGFGSASAPGKREPFGKTEQIDDGRGQVAKAHNVFHHAARPEWSSAGTTKQWDVDLRAVDTLAVDKEAVFTEVPRPWSAVTMSSVRSEHNPAGQDRPTGS